MGRPGSRAVGAGCTRPQSTRRLQQRAARVHPSPRPPRCRALADSSDVIERNRGPESARPHSHLGRRDADPCSLRSHAEGAKQPSQPRREISLLADSLCWSHDDSPLLAHPRKDHSIAVGRTGPKDPPLPTGASAHPNAQQASPGTTPGKCMDLPHFRRNWTVAGCRLISHLPVLIVARHRPASPSVCVRWLPAWLPGSSRRRAIGLHIYDLVDRVADAADSACRREPTLSV